MNPRSVMTFEETAEQDSPSPIESALMELGDQQERLAKALAVLAERLSPVLQPAEGVEQAPGEPLDGPKVSHTPQSPVARRLTAAADDLRYLSRRVDDITDRLDA